MKTHKIKATWLLLLPLPFLLLAGCSTNTHQIDTRATAAAPWKVGEVIATTAGEGDICLINGQEVVCHYEREFLGVNPKGDYLVQEFYAPQTVQQYAKNSKKVRRTNTYLINSKSATQYSSFDNLLLANPADVKGRIVIWYFTGNKQLAGQVERGLKQKHWLSWYENGKVQQIDLYDKGEKDDVSIGGYDNGERSFSFSYSKGIRNGMQEEWYPNGRLRSLGYYAHGKIDGKEQWWYDNGSIREERDYKDGKETGVWKKWNEKGELLEEIKY